MSGTPAAAPTAAPAGLVRRLGAFDAAMIVMGGIIGSGIFMNPSVVARQVHTPPLILGAWLAGGAIALAGAFIYAELAARRPLVGGQYAYLREAYHPLLAFVYAWGLLLVIQTGGMAASAVTFARYFRELTGSPADDRAIAAIAIGALTLVNCLGVRAGGTTQNALMLLKILAVLVLVAAGLAIAPPAARGTSLPAADASGPLGALSAFGGAMVPVLFAYGGWQTASFLAGEVRAPERNLPRGLIAGVIGVVVLYVAVSVVCLRTLGAEGLARVDAPASAVMRAAFGEPGARWIAAGIAISTLGFLSQSMLTAPRVYYAMARDGVFFGAIGRLHPRTHAPVAAIALQGVLAIVIAVSGRYDQILGYVVSADWIFFGLSASCLFVLRRRDARSGAAPPASRALGHPLTTLAFVAVSALVVVNTLVRDPGNAAIGMVILLAGVPVGWLWRRRRGRDGGAACRAVSGRKP